MTLAPEDVIRLLAFALLGLGLVVGLLPVGTCTECGHCRLQKLRREADLEARAARFYGTPRCPDCGRHHEPSEDHRA